MTDFRSKWEYVPSVMCIHFAEYSDIFVDQYPINTPVATNVQTRHLSDLFQLRPVDYEIFQY